MNLHISLSVLLLLSLQCVLQLIDSLNVLIYLYHEILVVILEGSAELHYLIVLLLQF